MHQIKRDSEPHLGSGKCILKNLIRKEILMDYRPSPHLRHFQNDKSQRPFMLPLSFFLFSCLSLFLLLFLCLLLSSSSHEPWLSIVRDYRSIAGLWPVEDLLLIFICIWNKPILSCRWAAEPCGPIVYIYMQEPVCVALVNIQYVCAVRYLYLCVPFWHLYPVLSQATWATGYMFQRPRAVFPTRVWSLAGLLALRLQG